MLKWCHSAAHFLSTVRPSSHRLQHKVTKSKRSSAVMEGRKDEDFNEFGQVDPLVAGRYDLWMGTSMVGLQNEETIKKLKEVCMVARKRVAGRPRRDLPFPVLRWRSWMIASHVQESCRQEWLHGNILPEVCLAVG